jgi:hypothetical protein
MCSILHLKTRQVPEITPLRCFIAITYRIRPYWLASCILRRFPVAQERHRSGCNFVNLTGDIVTRKPGRTLLPVLTVLFLVSYGLLTMLVVERDAPAIHNAT